MDVPWSSPPCPNTVTVRRNPPRKARPTPLKNPPAPSSFSLNPPSVDPFPIEDILSIQIPQNDQLEQPSSALQSPDCENLKVYLRIRPLVVLKGDRNERLKSKNFWPQNLAARKKAAGSEKCSKRNAVESCITVTDSQSVTLLAPASLQDSKRIKSELYQGFSHVFSAESSQIEVYEKMASPIVEDFLKGKSGMLAALGPSGSGKTHTVFGTARDPGIIPLALRQIFKNRVGSNSRLVYMSMFEISSERGKGERLFDLSPDGAEISMHRSTIKGHHETIVHNVHQAESLIASGMLRRSTAMTNTNSQSSRSQCIINFRYVVNMNEGEADIQSSDAVLTIVDLAGAEREKRTGNQGARLHESNFINNTSMVFSLCLRSLLEHQKNPKKALQKHFQNSLLTRYLRDYFEGKKRMMLILTVRSGEEDYVDTSYLLRQASPFVKIKFDIVEEPSNLTHNKRPLQPLFRTEKLKRMKSSTLDASEMEEGKIAEDRSQLSETGSKCFPPAKNERNYHILQGFAKALYNVLKEYRDKLKVADSEVKILRKNIRSEELKNLELEKKLKDFNSSCACSKENLSEAATSLTEVSEFSMMNNKILECGDSHNQDGFNRRQDYLIADYLSPSLEVCEVNSGSGKCSITLRNDQDVLLKMNSVLFECSSSRNRDDFDGREVQLVADIHCPKLDGSTGNDASGDCGHGLGNEHNAFLKIANNLSPSLEVSELNSGSGNCNDTLRNDQDVLLKMNNEISECSSSPNRDDFDGREVQLNADIHCPKLDASTGNDASRDCFHGIGNEDNELFKMNGSIFECSSSDNQNDFVGGQDQLIADNFYPSLEVVEVNSGSGMCNVTLRNDQDQDALLKIADNLSPSLEVSEVNSGSPKCIDTLLNDQDVLLKLNSEISECSSSPDRDRFDGREVQLIGDIHCPKLDASTGNDASRDCGHGIGNEHNVLFKMNGAISECSSGDNQNDFVGGQDQLASENNRVNKKVGSVLKQCEDVVLKENAGICPSALIQIDRNNDEQELHNEELLVPPISPVRDLTLLTRKTNAFHASNIQPEPKSSCKHKKMEKPRRRLMPSSSVLVRDITVLDVEDETGKLRANRRGKNLIADDTKRTKGSISLLYLLKSNLHLRD